MRCQSRNNNIYIWCWCGFSKVKTEVQWCSLVNPMLHMGLNAKLENIGINAYWYEHRLFINNKPMFRYKSRREHKMKIKRFLGVLLFVCLYNVDQ